MYRGKGVLAMTAGALAIGAGGTSRWLIARGLEKGLALVLKQKASSKEVPNQESTIANEIKVQRTLFLN